MKFWKDSWSSMDLQRQEMRLLRCSQSLYMSSRRLRLLPIARPARVGNYHGCRMLERLLQLRDGTRDET